MVDMGKKKRSRKRNTWHIAIILVLMSLVLVFVWMGIKGMG